MRDKSKSNSRELVYKTLEFNNTDRVPRQMWKLPWAENMYALEVKKILEDYPNDIVRIQGYQKIDAQTYGNQFELGEFIDHWGCKFINRQRGIVGEVKEPLIKGENWEDKDALRIPLELLEIDKEGINEFCRNTDKFVMASASPRIFERMQFIRGTETLFIDLMLRPKGMYSVIEKIHDYYCRLLNEWASTDVDALSLTDDWGSQNSLLINPELWEELFKPLYRDYIDIAHKHGKKIFMHSDGNILKILPHLIEIGLDAINSQLFCMGIEKVAQFKGQITFWGEIDRQQLLPRGSQEEIEQAVIKVKQHLWQNGGCIAQCEFGPGAKPENVYKVFETWNRLQ